MKNIAYFFIIVLLLQSCSPRFKSGGYFHAEKLKSFYANDRKKIYFQFADKFSYTKENFNAAQFKPLDYKVLKEFNVKPSRKILFTYHSFGRNMVAVLEPKFFADKTNYKEVKTGNGRSFLYRSETMDSAMVVDNLYPFKNKYIRVIEKTKRIPGNSAVKPKSQQQETYIFPEISAQKPF